MLTVTIDTNILVDLEAGAPRTASIQRLIASTDDQIVKLRLPAIMASERQPGGRYLDDFDAFLRRAVAVGFSEDSLVYPIGCWGVMFWQRCLWGDEESAALARAIHTILFDNRPYECPEGLGAEFTVDSPHPDYVAWRNAKCDVLVMWCHLHYRGDALVTADKNFHKASKRARLAELGAKHIIHPDELSPFLARAAAT